MSSLSLKTNPRFLAQDKGFLFFLLFVLVLIVSAAIVHHTTRQSVMNTLLQAAETGHIATLEERTDWDALRTWMKEDLRKRTHTVEAATSGYGLRDEAVDKLIDYYVQPANIPSLLYFKNEHAANYSAAQFVRNISFTGLNEFVIEFAWPQDEAKPWLASLEPVKAVFQLDGMAWKLKQLNAPLYALPQVAPGTQNIPMNETYEKLMAQAPHAAKPAAAE